MDWLRSSHAWARSGVAADSGSGSEAPGKAKPWVACGAREGRWNKPLGGEYRDWFG